MPSSTRSPGCSSPAIRSTTCSGRFADGLGPAGPLRRTGGGAARPRARRVRGARRARGRSAPRWRPGTSAWRWTSTLLASSSPAPSRCGSTTSAPPRCPRRAGACSPSAGTGAALLVPLVTRAGVFGAVTLAARRPRAFDATDVEVAVEIARPLASAIEQHRLLDERRRRAEEMAALVRDEPAHHRAARPGLGARPDQPRGDRAHRQHGVRDRAPGRRRAPRARRRARLQDGCVAGAVHAGGRGHQRALRGERRGHPRQRHPDRSALGAPGHRRAGGHPRDALRAAQGRRQTASASSRPSPRGRPSSPPTTSACWRPSPSRRASPSTTPSSSSRASAGARDARAARGGPRGDGEPRRGAHGPVIMEQARSVLGVESCGIVRSIRGRGELTLVGQPGPPARS